MTDHEQRQADLLDQFRQELAANPKQTPPAGLDSGVAAVAVMLEEHLSPPGPSARFVRGLDRRLASEAVSSANSRHVTLPASSDFELAASSDAADWRVMDHPRRSRLSELTRIAAAGLAVLLIGAILVLLFREVDDAAAPGIGVTPPAVYEILVSWDPEGGTNYKLYAVPTDGSEPRKLTPGPHEDDGVAERLASWSPDGQRVVYAREEDGRSDIYVMDVRQGSEPMNITRSPYHDTEPVWSPDGRRILFNSSGGDRGTMNIYIIDADGSNLEQLTSFATGALFQAWSPDGRQIAFARVPGDQVTESSSLQVWVMNADGSDPRPITNLDSIVDRPVWSQDGQHIAFWSAHAIWTISPDGSNLHNVSGETDASSIPAWASNDQRILYVAGSVNDGDAGFVMTDIDGAILERWSPEADILAAPSWSPDDRHIAYYAGIDRNEGRGAFWDFAWDLRIAGADGSDERSLLAGGVDVGWPLSWRVVEENESSEPDATSAADEILVSWDPDGGENYKLYVVPADGSEPRKLTPGPHEDDGISERFARWSPDGRQVVFVRHEENRQSSNSIGSALDLVVIDSDGTNMRSLVEGEAGATLTLPEWSPDGTSIAYIGGRDGPTAIYVINSDGSDPRALTELPASALYPSWSPDGTRIAAAATRHQLLDLWVVNADGGAAHPVVETEGVVERPAWSPDGRHIAFVESNQIWIVAPDAPADTTLRSLATEIGPMTYPSWSPDGSRLVYASGPFSEERHGVVVVDIDGVIQQRWTPGCDTEAAPAFSPDGRQIAFNCATGLQANAADPIRDARWGLSITSVDGSGEQALLSSGVDWYWPPEWRPSGAPEMPAPIPPTAATSPPADESPVPTPAMGGPPDPDEIPAAWLTHNGQRQRGEFAYGCNWPGFAVCVDPGGLVFPEDVLEVPEGAELIFTFERPEDKEIVNLSGSAYPLDNADIGEVRGVPFLHYPISSEIGLAVWGSTDAMNVVADLPAGDYAIAMNINASSGSATYGFHVRVAEVDEPQKDAHTTCTIVEVEQRADGVLIYIVEHPEAPNNGEQYYVAVNRYARVFERTATGVERRSVSDLQAGRRVTVSFMGAIADSYPGLATGSEIVIVRNETDGPIDPQDTVTMTFQHSLYTGSDGASGGDAFYVSYAITGGNSGDVFICASDDRSPDVCGSWGATYRVEVDVPRGAELHFSIYRLSRDNPDEPELVKRGREVVDADMITRSHYRYGASNPGGYD